jgi:hypothetical protein
MKLFYIYYTVTAHACYNSPWTLWSSLINSEGDWFIGETDLLACYDLFFVSGQICLVYIQFGLMEGDKVIAGGKSVITSLQMGVVRP